MTPSHKARILIVDDEAAMRAVLREYLEEYGYEILEASDGREALVLLEEGIVDLAIMDIFMPDMDGIQLLNEMRARSIFTRVIAVSGGGQSEFPELPLRMAKMLGALATLEKPLDLQFLAAEVERCLGIAGS